MDLADLLHTKGIDLQAVVSAADEAIGVHPDDLLLAVGSIVEGLGNRKSDIDLVLITRREHSALPADENIALVVGRCIVDLRILPFAELARLLTRLRDWSRRPWEIARAAAFTLDERVLLHRLRHGQQVLDKTDNRSAISMPGQTDLARLKLHIARHTARTIQIDMAGHHDTGDCRSLVFAAQDLLGHAVDGLTAGHQLTNPVVKWRSRLLDALPADWDQALRIRPTGRTAAEHFWWLHRAPQRPSATLALTHACRITTFARAVFLWAEFRLLNSSTGTAACAPWPQIQRHSNDRVLPHLDLDVDFVVQEEGHVAIARLNEFDEALEIPARESALMLLFDGVTTADEAEAAVYGTHGAVQHPGIAHRILSELARAGLCMLSAKS